MKAKRIAAAILCLCMAASSGTVMAAQSPLQAQADDVFVEPNPMYEDFLYQKYSDHVEITNTFSSANGELVIPDTIEGLPVTALGTHAIAGTKVTSVVLPDTITSIGKQAFYGCTELISVNIPEGVTELPDEVFLNCARLNDISLPDSLTGIGARAFYHCAMTELDIPENVTSIGEAAFDSCPLERVTLPKQITKLEDGVFNNTKLTELDVPLNVMTIGLWALPSTLERLFIQNPECSIAVGTVPTLTQKCVIFAPYRSEAQLFAEEWGYTFEVLKPDVEPPGPLVFPGDVNIDNNLTVMDVVLLQKWLLGLNPQGIKRLSSADMNNDDIIDVIDLVLVKRALLEKEGWRDPYLDYTLPPAAVNLSKSVNANAVTGAEADEAFVLGQTKFSLSLLQSTVEDGKNIFLSPYSIVQALGMAANGADGQTKLEMEQLIGGMPVEELNAYLYTQRTNQPNAKYCKLTTANSIWFRDDPSLDVKKPFLQTNADYYSADAFKAPFDNTTITDINRWVNTNTDGMIPELFKPNSKIYDDVMMYLIDAVAFDAKWRTPYTKASQLEQHTFTAFDGSEQTVEMLRSNEWYYLSDEHAEGFMKYYADGRYAFAALLPEEGLPVTDYIAGLTAEGLHETLANPEDVMVIAGLPKFSYDYEIELKDPLITMGMPTAFIPYDADFSPMATYNGESLYIGNVKHMTHINVFEEGTKAAALTAVEFDAPTAAPEPERVERVILDRPFVYCIVDTETALPVFVGTLMQIPE